MDGTTWSAAMRRGMQSGALASFVSTTILVGCGQRERNDAARAVNGPSQWVWGRYAPHVQGASVKHTVVGYAIHHAMSVFWATLFERFRPRNDSPAVIAAAAGVTATVAYVTDFKVVPRRVSPGFETELTPRCVVATYVGFAAALVAAALLATSHQRGNA